MKNTREQGEKVLNIRLIIVVFSVSVLHTGVKFQIVLAPVILYLRKSLFLIMLSICNQYLYLVTVSAWNVICVKKMWSEYNGSVFFFFCFALYGASHRYNFENASFLLNILLLPSVSYSNDMSQKLYTLGINMCYTGTIHLRYTVQQLELTHL